MSKIPHEIITDIFKQLPVKSLLRFRSLSKPICSLIDGPDFIKLHLYHSITAKSNHSVILKEWDLFTVDFDTLSDAVEVKHHPLYAAGGTEVIGSVNGLVFLRHSERNLAVYNLSTREWKKCFVVEIKPPRRDLITGYVYYGFVPAFFGWLSTAFIFAFQSLLIHRDVTTIEYLKGLTSKFQVRVAPTDAIAQDAQRRTIAKKTRRKDAAAASPSSKAASWTRADDERVDDEEDEAVLVEHGAEVDLMEAGAGTPLTPSTAAWPSTSSSPVATSTTTGAATAPSPAAGATIVHGGSFAYNPHKSFALLIWRRQPKWTVLVPPVLLRFLHNGKYR